MLHEKRDCHSGMKRKFEKVFEEKIEVDLPDDFKVELVNEDETESIVKSNKHFCQTHVKTEIDDHDKDRGNEDVKIEIFEAEMKHEENNFEDFAEDENHFVKGCFTNANHQKYREANRLGK